jgi:hypothetical protein
MSLSVGLHEELALVGRIKPQTISADAETTTGAIDMQKWDEVLFVYNLGDYGGGNDGTLTAAKITGDTASGGTYATDITGKALTPASFTGSAEDDAVGIIRVTREEVAAQGLRYIRAEITPTNQTLDAGVVAVGRAARYAPANNFDLAAVTEIIS